MRYDFRKVQEAIAISGKTLEEVAEMAGVHAATISRALRTGKAHQRTALALTKKFGVHMREIQVKPGMRKSA